MQTARSKQTIEKVLDEDMPLAERIRTLFLGKAVGFFSEHTWALIVFAAVPIGIWLIQKVKNQKSYINQFT